jgi:hypothetical protein
MTVMLDSRYTSATRVMLSTDRGPASVLYLAPPRTGSNYRLYIAMQGDTFDLLAHRLWNDPRLFWRIADMNPQVFFPGDIPPGTVLRLPA